MNLESQVVSLPLAKRLKELGVKQESLFKWAQYREPVTVTESGWAIIYRDQDLEHPMIQWKFKGEGIAAFTVAELGEMLKEPVEMEKGKLWICMTEPFAGIWYSRLCRHLNNYCETLTRIEADTEADSRAKMLVYLIEKGVVKP